MNNTRDAQNYRCSHCDYSLSFAAGTYTRHVAVEMLRADGWQIDLGEARCPKHASVRASSKPTNLEIALRASLADIAAKKGRRAPLAPAAQSLVVPPKQRIPALRLVHSDGDHERDTAGGSMAALAQRFGQ